MVNAGCTLHSDLPVVDLDTKRVKEPSPSVNPVTNQGLREDLVFKTNQTWFVLKTC